MATYKVLQDIEAEDTLIGALTLRQCIYAAVAVVAGYLSFVAISQGAAFLVVFLFPFIAFGLFFAFPWSKQQSTEVWALAKVRFYLKPRKRIWNQSGVKELVTITVPKNLKRQNLTNLTPNEVQSRLKALADTIDSRGWAVKNVDMGYYTKPSLMGNESSERLLNVTSLQQEVPNYDTTTTSDIFDVQNNPIAQKFDVMMTQAAGAHREQIMQQMAQQQNPAPTVPTTAGQAVPADYWHLKNVAPAVTFTSPQPTATTDAPAVPKSEVQAQPYDPAGQAMAVPEATEIASPVPTQPTPSARSLPAPDYASMRLPNVQATATPAEIMQQAPPTPQPTVTPPPSPAILELANNNDLNVATIAREAQSRNPDPPDEVIVSLR